MLDIILITLVTITVSYNIAYLFNNKFRIKSDKLLLKLANKIF